MNPLIPGDPAPYFIAPTSSNPRFTFDTAAGRYLLLCLMPRGDGAFSEALDRMLAAYRGLLNDANLTFFGVVRDRGDFDRRVDSLPGIRWFFDENLVVSRACRMVDEAGSEQSGLILIDPSFHVLLTCAIDQAEEMFKLLPGLPPSALHAGMETPAPVLIAPRIIEPDICRALIEAYEIAGGQPSGFMRDIDGKTVEVRDPRNKIRSDLILSPGDLRDAVRGRILRRLVPQIRKAFQFAVTRMERDLVACYDGEERGFFKAHRDNTTKGTAHRRFAATINLNAEDYDGGELRFPEFGPRLYRAPTGGAVVFSCSLLHEAMPVTRGRRYAFLPFLYDEAAATIREDNAGFVGRDGYAYRAGAPATAE